MNHLMQAQQIFWFYNGSLRKTLIWPVLERWDLRNYKRFG